MSVASVRPLMTSKQLCVVATLCGATLQSTMCATLALSAEQEAHFLAHWKWCLARRMPLDLAQVCARTKVSESDASAWLQARQIRLHIASAASFVVSNSITDSCSPRHVLPVSPVSTRCFRSKSC